MSFDDLYSGLVDDIIVGGYDYVDSVRGIGRRELFGVRLELDGGFNILTSKKMNIRNIVSELLWFMRGETGIVGLVEEGCGIWNDDAWSVYQRGGGTMGRDEWMSRLGEIVDGVAIGDLGPIYGAQWREQIIDAIWQIGNDPMNSGILINSWNVDDLGEMGLRPCHYACQFSVHDGMLDLMFQMRSCDVGLGLPYNICSYSILQEIICGVCGLTPGKLIMVGGKTHIYHNHLERIKRSTVYRGKMGKLAIRGCEKQVFGSKIDIRNFIHGLRVDDFEHVGYDCGPFVKLEMNATV